jgi:hypothetical protein
MVRVAAAYLLYALFCAVALAEDKNILAVIEPADAQALSQIIDDQLPPRYGRIVVEWFNRLVMRQQQRDKESLKPPIESPPN